MTADLEMKALTRLLALKQAPEDLLVFCKLTMPDPDDVDDVTRSLFQETPVAYLLCQIMQKVFRREEKRVGVSIGPQMGKSQILSRNGPAWIQGKNPYANQILASYNQPFADEFGDAVREIMQSKTYAQVFPKTVLRKSQKDLLITDKGGKMAFVGRGGSGTGKPADFLWVDDPLKDNIEAQSDSTRNEVWNWFNKVATTRCHSDSSILIVHCLAGSTRVTMGDGTRKNISDVKPGDMVLTWDEGVQVSRRVLNCARQGVDDVFEVRTGNNTVVANARHPFLVQRGSTFEWVKTSELVKGDSLVTSAIEYGDGTRLTQDEAWLLGFMFGDGWLTHRNGRTFSKKHKKTYPRRAIVTCFAFSKKEDENAVVEAAFERVFGFIPKRTRFGYWRTEKQAVGRWFNERGLSGRAKTKKIPPWLFRETLPVRRDFIEGFMHADGTIDKKKQVSIASSNESMLRDLRDVARSCGYRVSNVHAWSATIQPPNSPAPVRSTIFSFKWGEERTYGPFEINKLRTVKPVGRQEVFDLQIEGTENFTADGLVVHNTRWHQDDLIGRLMDPDHPERNKEYKGIADRWKYFNLPAVIDDPKLAKALGLTLEVSKNPFVVSMFGSGPISSLWPKRKGLPLLAEAKQMDPVGFGALYMGKPTPDDGDYFKADWLVEYEEDELPKNLELYGASDHAVSTRTGKDYNVIGCVGVDEHDTIWVMPDIVWERMDAGRIVEEILSQMRLNSPVYWWMEGELISKSFGPFLQKRMDEEQVYIPVDPVTPSKDKRTMARAIQGRMSMKKVRFPRFAHWWPEARRQILKFDSDAHDDFISFLSLVGLGLMKQYTPDADKPAEMRGNPKSGTIQAILQDTYARTLQEKRKRANAGW